MSLILWVENAYLHHRPTAIFHTSFQGTWRMCPLWHHLIYKLFQIIVYKLSIYTEARPEILVKSELRKFYSFIKRLGRKSQLRLNTRIIKCLSLQNIITDIASKLIFIQQIFTNSARCFTHISSFKLSEEILVQILK